MTTTTPPSTAPDDQDAVAEVERIVSEWMRQGITNVRNVVAMMMRKGGAGKTTTTLLIADALIRFGLNVLIVDVDPQGNTSLGLGRKVLLRAVEAIIGKNTQQVPDVVTVVEVINFAEPGVADEAIQIVEWGYDPDAAFNRGGPMYPGKVGKIGLISAYEALEDLPRNWTSATDYERLASALLLPAEPGGIAPNVRWDVVLLDSAIAKPIGIQVAKSAHHVLFVTTAQIFGTDAIPKTMRLLKDVQANYRHEDLNVMGLLWNEYDDRKSTEQNLSEQAADAHSQGVEHWEAPIWPYKLPNLTVVSNSHAAFAPLSAFLSTSAERKTARRVCQVAEAVALRVLDNIQHPQASALRQAWHEAWIGNERTAVMREDVA
ncbi:hypothetical protein GCM10022252_75750 [Streptosporangium oxazolinicum]|uniref:CobQ/CobB/MinD/ParA nucleotide binding domain-containing protein n=1 Tax=Streptosporangium oxazolinicum TaxID=909287 RepID=A0ABP8BL19_9ACTN